MRKTSHDGGDSTSITSGIENEIKKPGAIIKNKRSSLKRKVQNFSLESDDAVIEPLLQKDKETTTKPGAKFNLLSKTKTETTIERETEKDKLISDDKSQKAALSNASDATDRILPDSNLKENSMSKLTSANAPLHNHMNTNVFSNHDNLKTFVAPKSQILVEIDGSKHVGYNPSPLIFTTAKIHTDGKTKHMEPVQMTPVPILSTIEVSVMKSGINTGETSGHVTSNISAVYIPQSKNNITENDPKVPFKTVNNTTNPQNKVADTNDQIQSDKKDVKNLDKTSIPSTSNKETKLTQSTFSPNSVNDNPTDIKCINKDNKIEKEEYHLKTLTAQPNNFSAFGKNKVPQDIKFKAASVTTTKGTNSSHIESGIFNQTVTTKQDKVDTKLYPENKIDFNKTVKPDSLELQRSKPSDKVINTDQTSKEKNKDPTSFSNRQLQRQNVVLDKEDPIPKLKPNIISPTSTNNSRGFDKSGECQKSSTVIHGLSDKTKLPKSSANSFSITSVTSTSTSTASVTTTVGLNKKPTTTQITCIVGNSAVTNNSSTAITTSVTANKSSFPVTSSGHKMLDPITTTSNAKNIPAAAIKVSAPVTTAVAMKNSFDPITTAEAVGKSVATFSPSTTTTTTASYKQSIPSSTATAGNKITSSSTTTVGNKQPVPSSTATAGNKITSPATTTTVGNKHSFSSSTTAGNKITSPSSTTTVGNKQSVPSSTATSGNKITSPLTTTVGNKQSVPSSTAMADNKITSSSTAATTVSNKQYVPSSTATVGNKITSPSTTTQSDSKISGQSTITPAGKNKSSLPTSTIAGNKTSSPFNTGNKISSPSIATGNKISVSSTNSNKIGNPITVTATTNKISGPIITTAATKLTSGCTTTTTGVDKPSTSNSYSSGKPLLNSSSTVSTISKTPITKSTTTATSSASKPLHTEKYLSKESTSGNIKSGPTNETSTTKSQAISALNPKPTTTKPAKVTTVATPTTSSQQTTVVKSPTVTAAKSASTKPISQPTVGKSTEITPKSSTSNEKPLTVKSNLTSISSTTASGTPNVTSTASVTSSTSASSGSSSKSAEVAKQTDSKSKAISNGGKSFNA